MTSEIFVASIGAAAVRISLPRGVPLDCTRVIPDLQPDGAYCPSADEGQHFFHDRLAQFNERRLLPTYPRHDWMDELHLENRLLLEESRFVEDERQAIARAAAGAPTQPNAFMDWFAQLGVAGTKQEDTLFPWLAAQANLSELRWFIGQEVSLEAGFDDWLAMTQVYFPAQPKLALRCNFWHAMGSGQERRMHGPMLNALVAELRLDRTAGARRMVWESLALANLMVALAANRRYAYHAVGALGVAALMAPGRAAHVNDGLQRVGVSTLARRYFQSRAIVDVEHLRMWHTEVLHPLIAGSPESATAIAEGALMRLAASARSTRRYRTYFGIPRQDLFDQAQYGGVVPKRAATTA